MTVCDYPAEPCGVAAMPFEEAALWASMTDIVEPVDKGRALARHQQAAGDELSADLHPALAFDQRELCSQLAFASPDEASVQSRDRLLPL